MRYLFLVIIFCNTFVFANVFQLSTIVDDQQLVPIIKINGKTVIKVKDIGTKQSFSSTFERSEKMLNSLKQFQNQKNLLNRIRIRRNKADYVAYVDNIEIYRVTPSDVIGSNLSTYQMAAKWRENIVDALKLSFKLTNNMDIEEDQNELGNIRSPLVSLLSVFSNNSLINMLFQLFIFIMIQVVAILLTYNFVNKRHKLSIEEFQKRLKKFHGSQIRDRNIIKTLENKVSELSVELKSNNNDINNVSNIKN